MPPSNSIGRIRALLTGVLLLSPEQAVDLLADLTIGHLDIILGVTIIVHEGEETIVRDIELQKNEWSVALDRSQDWGPGPNGGSSV